MATLDDVSISQQQLGEEADKTAKAIDQDTKALQENTREMKRASAESRQLYGRLREQQSMWGTLAKDIQEVGNQVFTLQGKYEDLSGSVKGFARQLNQASHVSSYYQRTLDAMRKGQQAFSSSMVATTNDTAAAMDQSQKYVNAVNSSYREARQIAGEFRVEAQVLQKAVDDLNARFATQIAASGDMTGAMKSMQREAFIMGRYLGVEMSEVMDMWQQQLRGSTMTLEQSRAEIVMVAKQADLYAQEIKKMGDQMMKTGNIGKKQFVSMVQAAGQELKTGIFQAGAYSRALKGLLADSKKGLQTVSEQEQSAEAMQRFLSSVHDLSSGTAIFGARVSKSIAEDVASGKQIFQNEATQKRVEMIIREISNPVQRMQAIMSATKGDSEMSAMILKETREMFGENKTLALETMATVANGDRWQALMMEKQVMSGEMEQNFRKSAEEKAGGQRKKQVDVWRKSFDDMVKAVHTPKDLEYKMVANVEQIRQKLFEIAEKWPLLFMGMQVGGSLLKYGLGGGSARVVGQGGGLLSRLLGGAGAAGSGSGAASALGPLAALLAAGAAGYGGGKLANWGFGKAIAGNKGIERRLGKGADLTDWLGGSSTGRNIMETFMPAAMVSGSIIDSGVSKKLEAQQKETIRIRGGEIKKRKELIRRLDDQINGLQILDREKTEAEKEEIRLLKAKQQAVKNSIRHITNREEKESKTQGDKEKKEVSTRADRQKRLAQMTNWASRVDTSGASAEQVISMMLEDRTSLTQQDRGKGAFNINQLDATAAQDFANLMPTLPKNIQEKFKGYDQKKLADALQKIAYATKGGVKGSWDEITKKTFQQLKKGATQDAGSGWNVVVPQGEQRKQLEAASAVPITLRVEGDDEGSEVSKITTNAKGLMMINGPRIKLALDMTDMQGGLRKNEQRQPTK